MSARVSPANSPPFAVVAPFLLAAPAFLVVGGLLLAAAGGDTFMAINATRSVAITHAFVLGWVTTAMMGVLYQMSPVVISGTPLSFALARVQMVLHIGGVALFIHALSRWGTGEMALAGSLVALSLLLFAVNAGAAVWRAPDWNIPRIGLALALLSLLAAATLGVTWVFALQQLWFPITLGRLSAHAHLGLIGWLGLTLMALAYQLVSMFNVVKHAHPRAARVVLTGTAAAVAVLALGLSLDVGAPVRVVLGAAAAVGPLLWAFDLFRLLRARSRGRMDIQGHSTIVSLAFLVLAVALGLGTAAGHPLMSSTETARWPLAYAAAGLLGWMGTALVGNSFKVMPFLVWYHRYRPRVGRQPVPTVDDIYSSAAAHAVLLGLGGAALMGVFAALVGSLPLLHATGLVVAAVGVLHLGALLHMFLPKQSSRAPHGQRKAVAP
ncbi:MAG: hypothetical protein IT429_16870 [Gemmataceae bacterium]|nr:hypothetical protein [Gemmataceae bacterium]